METAQEMELRHIREGAPLKQRIGECLRRIQAEIVASEAAEHRNEHITAELLERLNRRVCDLWLYHVELSRRLDGAPDYGPVLSTPKQVAAHAGTYDAGAS